VGGEEVVTVEKVLRHLIGMAKIPIECVLDPTLLRPSDVTLQIPDCQKFRAATGWKPIYNAEAALSFLLEETRKSNF
jgi:nucleoside-diphosphate-sugar epimerase